MSSTNGLMGAAAFRKPGVPYYVENTPGLVLTGVTINDSTVNDSVLNDCTLNGGTIDNMSLIAPVPILAADETVSATISVVGSGTPSYKGALVLESGANASGGVQTIMTGRTTGATAVSVEIGNNAQTNTLSIGGASGLSQVFDEIYNPVDAITGTPEVQTVTPVGFSPNFGNIRPVFFNVTTNKLVVAQTSLIRFFEVTTPDDTGENVIIRDPAGNTYSDPEWTCIVAGFANASGDRTYNALTIATAGSPWLVRYDNAGTSGAYVNILAIHNSLMTGG